MCLCSCTERCVPDSRCTCLWRCLRARALCWGNGATAKTANTAVPHPYLVCKYQSWKLTHPLLAYQNHRASIVLQCSIIQQHSLINHIELSTNYCHWWTKMCSLPLPDALYIAWCENLKLTLYLFIYCLHRWQLGMLN